MYKKFNFRSFISFKNEKIWSYCWFINHLLSIYAMMQSISTEVPRRGTRQHAALSLEHNTLVTSIEPIDGCYCWLLCITICIHLSTTESYTPENCCNYSKLCALCCLFRCCWWCLRCLITAVISVYESFLYFNWLLCHYIYSYYVLVISRSSGRAV